MRLDFYVRFFIRFCDKLARLAIWSCNPPNSPLQGGLRIVGGGVNCLRSMAYLKSGISGLRLRGRALSERSPLSNPRSPRRLSTGGDSLPRLREGAIASMNFLHPPLWWEVSRFYILLSFVISEARLQLQARLQSPIAASPVATPAARAKQPAIRHFRHCCCCNLAFARTTFNKTFETL